MVGAYVGLTPRQHSSGERDPDLPITKAGDRMLRTLLIQCAHYILGPFGQDSDLRRFGHALLARGGKTGEKRPSPRCARQARGACIDWRYREKYQALRVTEQRERT